MTKTDSLYWEGVAREAAVIGGQVLLDYFGRVSFKSIVAKQPGDWVSEADKGSESTIMDFLRDVAPSHSILTEETGQVRGQTTSPYRWIIDPLDGTTNFLRGFPIWAVSVALEYKENPLQKWGEIIAGAIYVPLLSETFQASKDNGAKRNGVMITKDRTERDFKDCLIGTGFPFRYRSAMSAYNALFGEVLSQCADLRRPGAAAVDLCYTALGIFDSFYEIDLAPWDVAAGSLILKESGAVITDFQGGDNFMSTGDIIAGSPNIHSQLQKIVQKHFPNPRDIDKSINID